MEGYELMVLMFMCSVIESENYESHLLFFGEKNDQLDVSVAVVTFLPHSQVVIPSPLRHLIPIFFTRRGGNK